MSTRSADYWRRHPDSPIAKACSDVGAVRVSDSLRADISHAVSTRDMRRAYSLGVISASDGLLADQHQHASGLWPDLTPADYLAAWISTASAWSVSGGTDVATRAERPSDPDREALEHAEQVDRYATTLVTCGPAWYVEWLTRTVHAPKWGYLVELGAAEWLGAGAPTPPAAEWVDKVSRQWATRTRKGDGAVLPPAPLVEVF